MKTYIEKDTKKNDALWLIIEREDKKPNLEGIMGITREEDSAGNVAFPILKDEIENIRDACEEYLLKDKDYPTFYRTITNSKEWKEWVKWNEKNTEKEGIITYDICESTECGWLSKEHWNAFLNFIKQ